MTAHALDALGFDDGWRAVVAAAAVPIERVVRISSERRGAWEVRDGVTQAMAGATGRLRAACDDGTSARPSVGDWVVLKASLQDETAGPAIIESVLPRRTQIARKTAGRSAREQIVAANADVVFVVCALGRDVNERRIERFTAIVWNGGGTPQIILNKADLVDDVAPYLERVQRVAPDVAVHVVSARTGVGMEQLSGVLTSGRTIALMGTSGAGKSTLVNQWMNAAAAGTGTVRDDGKGRHTTTMRQLLRLPSGTLMIDTPGLREVGLWTGDEGVTQTFQEMEDLARLCRFSDCKHDREPGCAVRQALDAKMLDPARFESWQRLQGEQRHVDRQTDAAAAGRHKAAERQGTRLLQQRLRDKGRT
jgi:ribosome biogenesis GTPase